MVGTVHRRAHTKAPGLKKHREINEAVCNDEVEVNRTTIYRNLDRLCENGELMRFKEPNRDAFNKLIEDYPEVLIRTKGISVFRMIGNMYSFLSRQEETLP